MRRTSSTESKEESKEALPSPQSRGFDSDPTRSFASGSKTARFDALFGKMYDSVKSAVSPTGTGAERAARREQRRSARNAARRESRGGAAQV